WLQAESAGRLDRAIARLRERGEPFTMTIAAASGRLVEAHGRTVGSSAVVRFRDLSGDRLARAEIEARYSLLLAEVEAMRAMLAAAPMPVWIRDARGRLAWVNGAYAVADITAKSGSAGIAVDVTAIETAEAALRREVDFNARTLDQLATAVAIFGADRRLRSYNAAYRSLFDLEAAFLETRPHENDVIDRQRLARKLPEQADFRTWRADLLSAYQSLEAREHWWHLPDGQTLRVIANPNPQGGMTWIYENVTERLDLESRFNALIEVQGETLDHLAEGVGVFGSDGMLRLHNPSFAAIWGLP